MKTETEVAMPVGSAWYPLFEHMSDAYGLTLTDDELNSIASKADESRLKSTGSALPIPQALYSCYSCREDYSWPPQDLRWSAKVKDWVCDMCRDEGHGEPGPRLSEVLRRRTIDYTT